MDLTGISAFPDLELLPNFLDRVAREDPTKVWISCPNDVNDLSKGFRDYTTRELANWVNNASWYALFVYAEAIFSDMPGSSTSTLARFEKASYRQLRILDHPTSGTYLCRLLWPSVVTRSSCPIPNPTLRHTAKSALVNPTF